jgi:putative glycosyltransferase (TIGR04348 family)
MPHESIEGNMVALPRIGIASPAQAASNNGNWHTAARWAGHLAPIAQVSIFEQWTGEPLHALIALHARKSAPSVEAFRREHPAGRIVLVMTGTDLYRDLPDDDPLAKRSLELADEIVVLQERALRALPPAAAGKARVIVQSSDALPRAPAAREDGRPIRFIAIGHLRDVKDPLTLGRAAARLAADPRLRIEHVGEALDPRLAAELAALTRSCPNYRWLGGLPHLATLEHLQGADALVHPSRMEGGANVVIEAVCSAVPVLASAIDGNIGLLGEGYGGYFDAGDVAALAALMTRFASDGAFAAALAARCAALRGAFAPEREAAAVRALVVALPSGAATETPRSRHI